MERDELSEMSDVIGEYVELDCEPYYRISNSHKMADFFMSVVGADNHWMFVSSAGAVTAGRRNPDQALFPYGADDQISKARAFTGPATFVRLASDAPKVWQPFGSEVRSPWSLRRNLYKNALGNRLVFEEHNQSLGLVFRYRWAFSHRFGFVRSCHLENLGDASRDLEILDGLQDVLPHGVGSNFLMRFSNLANAYKKTELLDLSRIGLYYLSSVPTDRAEPSEGLLATIAWHTGIQPDTLLMSSNQIPDFLNGAGLRPESELRGVPGAYFIHKTLGLAAGQSQDWHLVAEVAQNHAQVIAMDDWLKKNADVSQTIEDDLQFSQEELLKIVASSDGLQCGANLSRANRHLSNTVFNVMRGGVSFHHYGVPGEDFRTHVARANRRVHQRHQRLLDSLPDLLSLDELRSQVAGADDPDLLRLSHEYLPLAFSRRHGDPTRPWNQFLIDLHSESGGINLDYQGNWRDIFQNWEALGVSFPGFLTAMISRFVNATTADGYNPYRLTKNGFDWEETHPDDPWANIGYWGDHQIIYLLKLLEWASRFEGESLNELLAARWFVHAHVPYRIKDFDALCKNPRDSIVFDAALAKKLRQAVEQDGGDAKLVHNQNGSIHRVGLTEKLLTLSLAKLGNFVPDGGIWLNTQRPEWNDANNALVGNGLSMVTACYLYRWFGFLGDWYTRQSCDAFEVSTEVKALFSQIDEILPAVDSGGPARLTPAERGRMVEALSRAGDVYRAKVYDVGFSGDMDSVSRDQIVNLFRKAQAHLEATIRNNRRDDGLYHAYNLMEWREDGLEVDTLYEMLEGQVAILSAGLLSTEEVISLLDALRASRLYRENQNSYLLYPDRQLPRFLEKNTIDAETASNNALVQALLERGDTRVVNRDIHGDVHFHGSFRNAHDLQAAIDKLDAQYDAVIQESGSQLIDTFQNLFGHRKFTGRSGTFFAYEGLGSIYWHMVSKLLLAVSENYFASEQAGADAETLRALRHHYREIQRGIGAEKPPAAYGAFPSDPYSHTPENAGVKQPGMTGQVKEDILSRVAEVGVEVDSGRIRFRFGLFDRNELLKQAREFKYHDVSGRLETITIEENGFAFLLFQVPFVYYPGSSDQIRITYLDGTEKVLDGMGLDHATSHALFTRAGTVRSVVCQFCELHPAE